MKIKMNSNYLWLQIMVIILYSISSIAWASIPSRVFAPYIDTMLYPQFSLSDMQQKSEQNYFTLAFITSTPDGSPAWGGILGMEKDHFISEIKQIRSRGGDVIISFGGANGIELALYHTDVSSLQQSYQQVIDKYQLTWIDFDIEGMAVAERQSIDRRNQAISGLQIDNPGLKVAYCLPVLPSGLTPDGLYVLQSALAHGVDIHSVNIMAMDYGNWAAPNPEGQMGNYAISAAKKTREQLIEIGLNCFLGITPMIGQNDVSSERFYFADATKLRDWAQDQDYINMLSMWSGNRDNGLCAGSPWADATCSGIEQEQFDFARIFNEFTSNAPPAGEAEIRFISPLEGQEFEQGQNASLLILASSGNASIVSVSFYIDQLLLVTDTDPPFETSWNNIAIGDHSLKAVLLNSSGQSVEDEIQVLVYGGCSQPAWQETEIYLGGNKVSHNAQTWKAKWWTQGEEPGTTGQWGVWEQIGLCTDLEPDPGTDPGTDPLPIGNWQTDQIYTVTEQVQHNGQLWEAKWWTCGEEPGTTGQWGVWKLIE